MACWQSSAVVDAVECAVSLQRGLAERNANVPDDQRFDVRIGINLGEVIVEGDDRWRRSQHRSQARATCRTRRYLRLGQGGQGSREETRLRLRADGGAESQEHRRAGPSLQGQTRRRAGQARNQPCGHPLGSSSCSHPCNRCRVVTFCVRPRWPRPRQSHQSLFFRSTIWATIQRLPTLAMA